MIYIYIYVKKYIYNYDMYIYMYIYTICINSFLYNVMITCARLRLKANVATDEGKDRNET